MKEKLVQPYFLPGKVQLIMISQSSVESKPHKKDCSFLFFFYLAYIIFVILLFEKLPLIFNFVVNVFLTVGRIKQPWSPFLETGP